MGKELAPVKISVPGSILLMGKYSISREGGLGIALAVAPRCRITVEPRDHCRILYTYARRKEEWESTLPSNPLISGVLCQFPDWDILTQNVSITIDANPFFDQNGNEKAAGSSAAACAGLTCALLYVKNRVFPAHNDLFSLSLSAIRFGGSSNGHDIAASVYGGLVSLIGGYEPLISPVSLPFPLPMYKYKYKYEHKACSRALLQETPFLIEQSKLFSRWAVSNPEKARAFLFSSMEKIQLFQKSRTREEALDHWKNYIDLEQKIDLEIQPSGNEKTPFHSHDNNTDSIIDTYWDRAQSMHTEPGIQWEEG